MNLFATTVRRVAGAWPCSELELNHVVSTVWGDAKGSRLEQSLFCRVGHCFSSLMWFIPSSQGRRIHLELTAHKFVIRAPVMQASLLQSSACFHVPLEHTWQACLHPDRGRAWDTGKCGVVWWGIPRGEQNNSSGPVLLPLCVPWLAGIELVSAQVCCWHG